MLFKLTNLLSDLPTFIIDYLFIPSNLFFDCTDHLTLVQTDQLCTSLKNFLYPLTKLNRLTNFCNDSQTCYTNWTTYFLTKQLFYSTEEYDDKIIKDDFDDLFQQPFLLEFIPSTLPSSAIR